jgi:hypothetical protein
MFDYFFNLVLDLKRFPEPDAVGAEHFFFFQANANGLEPIFQSKDKHVSMDIPRFEGNTVVALRFCPAFLRAS